ncbi:hypothetical protein BC629DRAFT_1501544 [Irpex lacteus]|nr:hypothetical protein BC629DRAFT_1501544 [Irpex lacteus]
MTHPDIARSHELRLMTRSSTPRVGVITLNDCIRNMGNVAIAHPNTARSPLDSKDRWVGIIVLNKER